MTLYAEDVTNVMECVTNTAEDVIGINFHPAFNNVTIKLSILPDL